jgi:hypothetical protein
LVGEDPSNEDEATDDSLTGEVGGKGGTAPAGPLQRLRVNLAGRAPGETLIHPAQIAFFAPDAPATLVLNEIE